MDKYFYYVAGAAVILIILNIIQAIAYGRKLRNSRVSVKVIDTSVVIDGRIADICRAGFLEGTLIVPRFMLQELQYIADSPDALKRSKGRRGLDVLNEVKKCAGVDVQIVERDFKEIRAVDEKLVALAKELGGKVVTNDYNLNKVAEIHGVQVLNINDLSNSIKPTYLPGERITVKIVKEGKEKEQGVAYLNDGTMIVVDNSRKMMGKKIEATVTNVLQTDAGRMIFARYDGRNEGRNEGRNDGRNDRNENNSRNNRGWRR